MKKIYITLLIGTSIFFLFGCKTAEKQISPYYNYETECLQNLYNGVQRLKVWSTGTNKRDAILNAKKRALNDFLFKGINKGNRDCSGIPFFVNQEDLRKKDSYMHYLFTKNRYKKCLHIVGEKYQSLQNRGNIRIELIVDIDAIKLKEILNKKKN